MSRTAVIHQPDFLPWLGFFDRLLASDLYIVLDHVQFARRGWTHRDSIKTSNGASWITLSIQKASRDVAIKDVKLMPEAEWRRDNLNLIRQNYQKAPFFKEVFADLEKLYARGDQKMVDMNIASLDLLERMLDIHTPRLNSSEMDPQGTSTAMLVDLLKKAGVTRYLSGQGARAYLEEHLFADAGIELVWQDFAHPVYPQLHGQFISMLSSIDALFNCGPEGTRNLLRNSQ
jgi:hypothetical protein